MPARGPVVLSEDEIERVLDLLGPPSEDDSLSKQLRSKLSLLLAELRSGATPSLMYLKDDQK